jgi:hypothetical protein
MTKTDFHLLLAKIKNDGGAISDIRAEDATIRQGSSYTSIKIYTKKHPITGSTLQTIKSDDVKAKALIVKYKNWLSDFND